MKFEEWYSNIAKKHDYNPNPKDWEHYYDYEGAFNAGIMGPDEETGHWPSEFKHDFHPNRFIDQGDGSFLDKSSDLINAGMHIVDRATRNISAGFFNIGNSIF